MFYDAFPYNKYFTEGKTAKTSGKNIYDCPYDYGTKEFNAWLIGFES